MTLWNEQSSPRLAFFKRWWGWIVTLGAAMILSVMLVVLAQPEAQPVTVPPTVIEKAPVSEPVLAPEPASPQETVSETPAAVEVSPLAVEETSTPEIPVTATSTDDIATRVAELEERIRVLESRGDTTSSNTLYAILYKLRMRFDHGKRADDVLAQLADMPLSEPQQELFKELTVLDRKGVDSPAELTRQFSRLADKLASAEENADGVTAGMKRWVTTHIVIRKVGEEHTGNDDGSLIARAEAHLQAGNVELALAELDNTVESTQRFFAPWRLRAENRENAVRLLEALEQTLAPKP